LDIEDHDSFVVRDMTFVHPTQADEQGLVGLSYYLDSMDVLTAYRFGIFPVNNPADPILWWSPDPRWVLDPHKVYISKSMRKIVRERPWRVTCDTDFQGVISKCSRGEKRKTQEPSGITPEYIHVYKEIFAQNRAHSFEVWDENGTLIGGLYGVITGRIFSGESMFANISNTSKYAFILACEFLVRQGIVLIDCQMHSDHLESLGAYPMRREGYLNCVRQNGFDIPSLIVNMKDPFSEFMKEKYP